MSKNKNNIRHTLGGWIKVADDFYGSAKVLDRPDINLTFKCGARTSWYIIHHALELFLKAALIQYDKFSKSRHKKHSLKMLTNEVRGLNPSLDNELDRQVAGRKVSDWIRFIEPFGNPNGGLRYLQEGKNMYAAPVGVILFFEKLVQLIKEQCDTDKEISKYL